ncbi:MULTISPECIES: AAA family ATPase [unclassified Cyanobium]|uniref:AAA family ATPase n=1 Tax=unclassified Cyanobium TaxID=2627006 RepID=UPI0020CF3CCB|nr:MULTISPECIES: AAA family ATPase [unclassified Cyanobium]MCP9835648.1 AAA family ATPase [Cyanobium sp. La Preciosa 7G6]MCP9938414.1 AAA family ATPase [Cyanobium sp. Aljojuca 7A6]
MRIAISGSHSLGKSTVVNDWVASQPGFRREEEPYRALGLFGPYEIKFREASTRLQNGIQLYYNISRIHRYASRSDDVIFDRAPVDYLAYSQYTANQATTDIDDAFVASMVPAVRESLDHLDILAFVPKSETWPVAMEEDGIRPVDHAYRDDVDAIFKEIYRDGRFDVMPQEQAPRLIDLIGPAEQRLDQLKNAIRALQQDRRSA